MAWGTVTAYLRNGLGDCPRLLKHSEVNGLGDCPRILKHSEVKHHGRHGSPHSRDTESSNERDLRAFRWQESMFNMI